MRVPRTDDSIFGRFACHVISGCTKNYEAQACTYWVPKLARSVLHAELVLVLVDDKETPSEYLVSVSRNVMIAKVKRTRAVSMR